MEEKDENKVEIHQKVGDNNKITPIIGQYN